MTDLQQQIEALFALGAEADKEQARETARKLREGLSDGSVRAAEPDASTPSGWRVNAWVKRGILLAFRAGATEQLPPSGVLRFSD